MSFTDQKPHIVTPEDVRAPWSGHRNGKRFYCRMCGHQFLVGDSFRWVWAGVLTPARVNLLVCGKCDGDDVLERYQQWWLDWEYLAQTKFRYIADRLADTERRQQHG